MRRNGTNRDAEPEPELPPDQAQAAELLAAGRGPGAVAQAVGVARGTLWRWRRAPAFRAACNRAMIEALDETRSVASALRLAALRHLQAVLEDPAAPPAIKLGAAREALRFAPLDLPQPGPDSAAEVAEADRGQAALRALAAWPR